MRTQNLLLTDSPKVIVNAGQIIASL